MIWTDGERESEKSVLSTRFDDDDDCNHQHSFAFCFFKKDKISGKKL